MGSAQFAPIQLQDISSFSEHKCFTDKLYRGDRSVTERRVNVTHNVAWNIANLLYNV